MIDENNINDFDEDNERKSPKKERKYKDKNIHFRKQQDVITYKLFEIMDLDMFNQISTQHIMESDKNNKICELLPDIRTYYNLTSRDFLYNKPSKKLAISIIKAIISTTPIIMTSEHIWSRERKRLERVHTFDLNGYKLLDKSFFINKKRIK